MQIVIDISDNDYQYIKGLNEGITDYHTTVKLYRAVRGGTVLPKGHGNLIDRGALKETIRKRLCISSLKYLTEQEKVVVEEIDNAPIIIEIDTENDND